MPVIFSCIYSFICYKFRFLAFKYKERITSKVGRSALINRYNQVEF